MTSQNSLYTNDVELGVKYTKRDDDMEVKVTNGSGRHAGSTNGAAKGHGSVLSAHHINYWVKVPAKGCCKREDKQILYDVSAVFKQGMSAIMGPTGSGKTSFLDVLAGRKDPRGVQGHLLLDGKPVPSNFKCMVGYVVQDDVVMGTLTVRENFAFSAALRLPPSVTASERKQKVSQVVKDLGLERYADTRVGDEFVRGVSGGERKRCNIGMELIISPPVLFLDEPTTGLDANTANTVLLFLKRLSRKGRTIIFSIHQPRYSIYRLFDSLMLLSKGETIYHGPAREALQFFTQQGFVCHEHNNPSDFFLDVINGDMRALAEDSEHTDSDLLDTAVVDTHNKLFEGFKNSPWFTKVHNELDLIFSTFKSQYADHKGEKHEVLEYASSFGRQVCTLTSRSVKNMVRNPATIGSTMGASVFFAIIMSAIYWQLGESTEYGFSDREGLLFFLVANQIFSNQAAVEIFINDRKIFLHETASGFYRLSSYFLVKVLFDIIPLRLLPTVLFTLLVYWTIDLRSGADNLFLYMLTLFLVSLSGCTLCFLYSSTIRVYAAAQLALTLTYILMLLFGGFLINWNSIGDWLSWAQYLSICKYGTTALFIVEFKDRVMCDNATNCVYGNDVLERSDRDYKTTWDFWENEVAMIAMSVGFLALSYIQLRRMKNAYM